MADDKLGIYFTNPPSKPKQPDWRVYLFGYLVPWLVALVIFRILAGLVVWLLGLIA